MADLPDEVIEIIRKHLDLETSMHVAQFRAVSQSWRSSIPSFNQLKRSRPQDHPLLSSRIGISYSGEPPSRFPYTIQRNIVYHIAPYPPQQDNDERKRGWLMRLDTNQKLLPPLSWRHVDLENTRVMMNSLDYSLREVAKPYLLAYSYNDNEYCYKLAVSLYIELFPAVMLVMSGHVYLGKCYPSEVEQEYCLQLAEENPDDDDDDPSSCRRIMSNAKYYEHVIFYQGKFCVVSRTGEASAMDSSFKWEVIAYAFQKSSPCTAEKYLVESLGELLLVERRGCNWFFAEDRSEYMLKEGVKFKVYKLDANRKQWVEMKGSDLDDRILVVGEAWGFSVSSRDFPGCKGNCVYFPYEDWCGKPVCSRIGVFHLDVGTASPLEAGTNIFRPPP